MSIRLIDITEARDSLKECVAERGEDFVYKRMDGRSHCQYIHRSEDGTTVPGCGVGMALLKLGVPESAFIGSFNRLPVLDLEINGFRLTSDAREYLNVFQTEQDDSTPWGEALEIADRRAGIED